MKQWDDYKDPEHTKRLNEFHGRAQIRIAPCEKCTTGEYRPKSICVYCAQNEYCYFVAAKQQQGGAE